MYVSNVRSVDGATFAFHRWNVTIHLYFSSCKLDMFKFPYDSQKCYLDFGNTAELDSMVNITVEKRLGFSLEFYSESNEFHLKSTEVSSSMWTVSVMNRLQHYFFPWLTHLHLDKMAAILADDILKCIFLNEKFCILVRNSLKFVPKGPIDNKWALVQIMAWRRTGDKPIPGPMMT